MGRHYSTREVFRQMPNALLARYFESRGQLGHLDFSAMKETRPDELFAAWLELPDSERNQMDAELREIFELSCEKGFRAIIDEADWHLSDDANARLAFVEKLSALSNHFERAMVTFLDHHEFWKGATRFYHADTLPYWRKRKNLPPVSAAVDEASLGELARLRQKGFEFVSQVGSGIESVAVKKLRLSSKVKRGNRIAVEADPTGNPDAVYELLDGFGAALSLGLYNVTQVELAASVVTDTNCPPKTVTIRITHPNSCSLKYDELDLRLRDMLSDSGIEPKEPAEPNEAAEALETA